MMKLKQLITSWFMNTVGFLIGPFEILGTILFSGGKAKFSSAEKTEPEVLWNR